MSAPTTRAHWPEYLMEATLLGGFMLSACGFSVLLLHPISPLSTAVADPLASRLLMGLAMGTTAVDPSVNFATTVPGPTGPAVAFVAELVISFVLMGTVLAFSNTARLSAFTGLASSALVATYITLEAPLSGMSMNPARTVGSAAAAELWVYCTTPPLGMLLAAEAYVRLRSAHRVHCAKLHHRNPHRGIFRCTCGEIT